jgi:predicted nucleic acid-binding protein
MIYLDSCVVIYLVEKHPDHYAALAARFREHASVGFAISPLVIMECLVGPLRRGDEALQQRFERLFGALQRLPMAEAIFRNAAAKRASHSIKTPDALHLVVAEAHRCAAFWTNDDRLKSISPLVVNVTRWP